MALTIKTKKYLLKNCPCDLECDNKTILITGANSGIGYKTAELMLYFGAKVIMACRNLEKAKAAIETLKSEYPDSDIRLMELDLADFKSIDAFAKQIQDEKIDIDCFINNAGIFRQPGKKTAQGLELVLGTNYFGTYRVCSNILPYLKTLNHPVTFINTISLIHKIGKIDFSDFYMNKNYGNFKVYARSKLAIARMTNYLVEQYKDTNIKILMNHPGISLTPIGLKAYGDFVFKVGTKLSFLFNSPEKSALSVPFILSHENALNPGDVVGPTKLFGGWGYPKINWIYSCSQKEIPELMKFTEEEIKRIEALIVT